MKATATVILYNGTEIRIEQENAFTKADFEKLVGGERVWGNMLDNDTWLMSNNDYSNETLPVNGKATEMVVKKYGYGKVFGNAVLIHSSQLA